MHSVLKSKVDESQALSPQGVQEKENSECKVWIDRTVSCFTVCHQSAESRDDNDSLDRSVYPYLTLVRFMFFDCTVRS